jgi:hypothetical protein
MVGKRSLNNNINSRKDTRSRTADLESGQNGKRFAGFKDAVDYVMDRRTTIALKEQLKKGVDRREFEAYRKSQEDACLSMNTKIRSLAKFFFSDQKNQRQENSTIL